VLVRGKLERDDETVRIIATEIAPLESVRERLAREIAIHLKTPADRNTLESLGQIFARHRGDRKILFEVETGEPPNRLRVRVDVSSQIRVRPSSALISEVEELVGAGAVELR
jgi:DNA polymerase III alpha subunit